MTSSPSDARCAAASLRDDEPMAGTAPTDTAWLLVEYAGAWGARAVADSRLPPGVRDLLGGLAGVRVQLIRRHGGVSGPGVRVFAARLGVENRVWTTLLDDVGQLSELDLAGLATGEPRDLTPYDEPLWLVCTNGRRDLCCAALGRPIVAALAARWPEATWETTHLGGHRFSGTLLALPDGVALGRLDPDSAVAACHELEAGRLPVASARGRAGLAPSVQVADLHLRRELDVKEVRGIEVLGIAADGAGTDRVTLAAGDTSYDVRVTRAPGEARRLSCADLTTKPADVYAVGSWGTTSS